jgi:hypothetical protein
VVVPDEPKTTGLTDKQNEPEESANSSGKAKVISLKDIAKK